MGAVYIMVDIIIILYIISSFLVFSDLLRLSRLLNWTFTHLPLLLLMGYVVKKQAESLGSYLSTLRRSLAVLFPYPSLGANIFFFLFREKIIISVCAGSILLFHLCSG